MIEIRIAAIVAFVCFGVGGCAVGGPNRANDIQNLHAISDDISATTMTDSEARRTHDPNQPTTLPNHYETYDIP